jgi:hypothetical protein
MNPADECPVCLERMEVQEQDGRGWLICPNGCPTEIEIPKKPADAEPEAPLVARATGTAG